MSFYSLLVQDGDNKSRAQCCKCHSRNSAVNPLGCVGASSVNNEKLFVCKSCFPDFQDKVDELAGRFEVRVQMKRPGRPPVLEPVVLCLDKNYEFIKKSQGGR